MDEVLLDNLHCLLAVIEMTRHGFYYRNLSFSRIQDIIEKAYSEYGHDFAVDNELVFEHMEILNAAKTPSEYIDSAIQTCELRLGMYSE